MKPTDGEPLSEWTNLSCERAMVAGIGLGANLDDREATLRAAIDRLEELGSLEAVSAIYDTDPIGPAQPRYLNAAVRVSVDCSPGALLDALQAIEAAHGRVRSERWGPRTLDLDLLILLAANEASVPAADGRSSLASVASPSVRVGEDWASPTLLRIDSERLTVPHRELLHRTFALAPILEVFPELRPFWDANLVSLGGPPVLHTFQMVVVSRPRY